MTWTIDDVVRALSVPNITTDEKSISLPIFDETLGIGVGVDGFGAGTLVLPGQQSQSSFETTALKFDPWCETTWIEASVDLPKSAVLRCRFDRTDKQLVRLVAGVLLSLIDLQVRFGDAGNAIWTLREIFGEGFKVSVQNSIIRGLLGELLVIKASSDIQAAISAWHVDTDDRYDFSIQNQRVEVKTTTSSVRQHRFTSRQLPPLHGIEVWVASVQLAEVSIGDSLSSLYLDLSKELSGELMRKLSDVIIETVGLPATAIQEPQFDAAASLQSIRLFPGEMVPTPQAMPGTSDIKWTAYLDEADGVEADKLNRIFVGGLET